MTGRWMYPGQKRIGDTHLFTSRYKMGFSSLCGEVNRPEVDTYYPSANSVRCNECLDLVKEWERKYKPKEARKWLKADPDNHIVINSWRRDNSVALRIVDNLYAIGVVTVEVYPIPQDLTNEDDIEPGEHVYGFLITPGDNDFVNQTLYCYICNTFDRCEEDRWSGMIYASWSA